MTFTKTNKGKITEKMALERIAEDFYSALNEGIYDLCSDEYPNEDTVCALDNLICIMRNALCDSLGCEMNNNGGSNRESDTCNKCRRVRRRCNYIREEAKPLEDD